MRNGMKAALLAGLICLAGLSTVAQATHFSAWGTAQKIDEVGGNSSELNTQFQDGCPIQSPDGLSLYLASNRPRFAGDTRTDLDIWVAHRQSRKAPWGAPGQPGRARQLDRGRLLSDAGPRQGPLLCEPEDDARRAAGWGTSTSPASSRGAAGVSRRTSPARPRGRTRALDEQGPSYVKAKKRSLLYFSSSSATVPGDIYVSQKLRGGSFGPAAPVAELNSAGNDIQPNVRKDGREVVFSSNRPGTLGGQDVWVATRDRLCDPWSAPVNIGEAVNTAASESRPSLSRDAQTLLFGRSPGPEGSGDIFVSIRAVKHSKH